MVRSERVGFLNDQRRINVSLTRAKHFLFVIGNFDNLDKGDWGEFKDFAQENNANYEVPNKFIPNKL